MYIYLYMCGYVYHYAYAAYSFLTVLLPKRLFKGRFVWLWQEVLCALQAWSFTQRYDSYVSTNILTVT